MDATPVRGSARTDDTGAPTSSRMPLPLSIARDQDSRALPSHSSVAATCFFFPWHGLLLEAVRKDIPYLHTFVWIGLGSGFTPCRNVYASTSSPGGCTTILTRCGLKIEEWLRYARQAGTVRKQLFQIRDA